jgi:predicted flap endonuclease-1-like 5' DNA nuclease
MIEEKRPEIEALERERDRLEALLDGDSNWQLLRDLEAGRNNRQFESVADRAELERSLRTVLALNRYYLARGKIVEAIALLSTPAEAGESPREARAVVEPPPPALAATIARARRSGFANRIVMIDAPAKVAASSADRAPTTADAPAPSNILSDGQRSDGSEAAFAEGHASRPVPRWPVHQRTETVEAADRLELISGLDVGIRKQLSEIGVHRFEQIATWSAADVAHITTKIRCRDAMMRHGWIEQAAALAAGRKTAYARLVELGLRDAVVAMPTSDEGIPSDALLSVAVAALPVETSSVIDVGAGLPPEPPSGPQASDETTVAPEPFLVLADHDGIRFKDAATDQQRGESSAIEGRPLDASAPQEELFVRAQPIGKDIGVTQITGPDVASTRDGAGSAVPSGPAEILPTLRSISSLESGAPVAAAAANDRRDQVAAVWPSALPDDGRVRQPPPVPEPDSMMERLAKLERELTDLDAAERRRSRLGVVDGGTARVPSPRRRPLLRARRTQIEDEEFPQLKVDEADLFIVKRGEAATQSTTAPDRAEIVHRMRRAFEPQIEAERYAGYLDEVEEASVEIVRKGGGEER